MTAVGAHRSPCGRPIAAGYERTLLFTKCAHILAIFACVGAISSCASSAQVERRRGEVHETGRSVPPLAYAWFARGVHHERQGEFKEAERAYRSVLDLDPKSGAAWAALGRILCTRNRARANEIFSQGLSKAERHAPVLVERGRCSLEATRRDLQRTDRGPLDSALKDALAALALEPKNDQANRLVVESYAALGNNESARRYERAFRLFMDESTAQSPLAPYRAIDEALWRGDLSEAQSRALTVVSPGALAARAAYWGQIDLAHKQADLVLRASPNDADALITKVVLSGAAPPFHWNGGELSPVGILLFSNHLARHASEAEAAHFVAQHAELLRSSGDPLVTSVGDYPATR